MSAPWVSSPGNFKIRFDEATHTYTRNGHTAPLSVTKLISNHFPEFDGPAVVDRCFCKWKENEDSKYYDVIKSRASDEEAKRAILDGWEQNKQEACRLGTALHKAIETRLTEDDESLDACDNSDVQYEFDAFLGWYAQKREQGWKLYASELVVGGMDAEDKLCLGGSVDAVFLNGEGKHVLVDWKRTKDPFGPEEQSRFAQLGSGPASELKDTKFNKYALQTAVYAQLLKRHIDIDVGDRRYLVRLSKEDGAQEISASGEAFERAASGLLRVAGVTSELPPSDENDSPPKRQKTETAQGEEDSMSEGEREFTLQQEIDDYVVKAEAKEAYDRGCF